MPDHSGVLNKGDIHNMQSSGSQGLELRTPDLSDAKGKHQLA